MPQSTPSNNVKGIKLKLGSITLNRCAALYQHKRPSKTDSAPVRGDGYKPESSKSRLRANAEMSHSVRYDLVVVVMSIMGGGEKFLHRIVRS